MNTYLTIFIIALGSSLFLTPVARRRPLPFGRGDAPAVGWLLHNPPPPRLGGVAIFFSVALALAWLPFVGNLVTESLKEHWSDAVAVLASSALVFLFGVFDDLVGAKARWKFVAQVAAGLLFYALGGRIEAVTVPFVGSFAVPPVLSLVFTLLWVVGGSNAFNLLDRLDRLATGPSLFAALVVLAVALLTGRPLVAVISLALAAALIGFLRYNFNPASIFLGDSGSLFIGFLLAALSVAGSQKASTAVAVAIPLMAFALPVIDTCFAIARRFIAGRPLFEGDREHIHHKLLERGWSQRRVAFVLYGARALFGLLALLLIRHGGAGELTGLLLLVTGAAVVLIAGRLRYHEADEVRAGLRRNIVERRVRAANHIRVRRASRALSHAHTLAELFAAVREMLELGEFAYATVQLGRGGDHESSERVLLRESDDKQLGGGEVRGGLICWDWGRGDVAGRAVPGPD